MPAILATLYVVILIGVVLFQLCLIAGAPWGRLTQGGAHAGKLPLPNRIGASVSILLLTAMGLLILSAAGGWPYWPIWTGWAALATAALSAVMNCLTPSVPERRLWALVTLILLALAGLVMAMA